MKVNKGNTRGSVISHTQVVSVSEGIKNKFIERLEKNK